MLRSGSVAQNVGAGDMRGVVQVGIVTIKDGQSVMLVAYSKFSGTIVPTLGLNAVYAISESKVGEDREEY